MTRYAKAVVIAAGAVAVLGGTLAVLLLTKPKPEEPASDGTSVVSETYTQSAYIVDKNTDEVLSLRVENKSGSYTFKRQKRAVTQTDESGNVTTSDEYYWTCGELLRVRQNESKIRGLVSSLASFIEKSTVEENAGDLEKYGLKDPEAEVYLSFEDGTDIKMQFGIQNPADESAIYFRSDDGNKVSLVNYYAAAPALSDVRQFAMTVMTEGYMSDASNEIASLKITRKDLGEPVEIRYMSELEALIEDEGNLVSTFNMHRFVSPVSAELDLNRGKAICQGLYSLTMSSCEYLEKTSENLKKCGLDDPFVTVSFRFIGGSERTLLIGNEIREEQSAGESLSFTELKGYYAVMSDAEGIYCIAPEDAPWVTFKVADIISRRPLSPYIYSVESIDVTTPEGSYSFGIDGESKTFTCGGSAVDPDEFRSFYQTLVSSIGEEMYSASASGSPVASVTFNYKEKYAEVYGGPSDTLEFYESDDRKNIVVLNGTPIFRVRSVYTERLRENAAALVSGGKVNIEW